MLNNCVQGVYALQFLSSGLLCFGEELPAEQGPHSEPHSLVLCSLLQVNVSVMKVLRGASSSLESPIMKIEAKSLVRRPSGEGGWVSLNVEELLSRWFENPKENHGIVLHAADENDRQIVVTDHEEDNGALVSVLGRIVGS